MDDQDSSQLGDRTIHVFDLPQIYQKPTADDLLRALSVLAETRSGFGDREPDQDLIVDPTSVPRYLTNIISSSLDWIDDGAQREQIWDLASLRLNERAGSNAAPSKTRTFVVNEDLVISLHEPTLTEDNLGFKTWGSSLLMARQLTDLSNLICGFGTKVLELGAGTGLVGIAVACLWSTNVTLTDLPEILPNLQTNLELNQDIITSHGGRVQAKVLDWSDTSHGPQTDDDRFNVIVAADPIYSPEHPAMLARTVRTWLDWRKESKVILTVPLRAHYDDDRAQMRRLFSDAGLMLIDQRTLDGFDDWVGANGRPQTIQCWLRVWQPDIAEKR